MRAPTTRHFIHNTGKIAFDPVGRLEFTLAQVESLGAHHMSHLIFAISSGDEEQIALHRAAERTFRLAMEDHTRWGMADRRAA